MRRAPEEALALGAEMDYLLAAKQKGSADPTGRPTNKSSLARWIPTAPRGDRCFYLGARRQMLKVAAEQYNPATDPGRTKRVERVSPSWAGPETRVAIVLGRAIWKHNRGQAGGSPETE